MSSTTCNRRKPLMDISFGKETRKRIMLSSDSESESEPTSKKIKYENVKSPSVNCSPVQRGGKTKTLRRSGRKSIIKGESEDVTTVKEEAQDVVNVKKETLKIKDEEEEKEVLKPTGQLSEYELLIQKNIEARAKFMETLDIFTAKENILELTPVTPKSAKKEYRGIARESKTPVGFLKIRRSLRQRNMTPDGAHLTLPSEKEIAMAKDDEEVDVRPPSGPAHLMEYYKRDDKEECENLVQDIQKTTSFSAGKASVWSGNIESVMKVMKSMKITDNLVAKVTPQRSFSILIHPSEDKTLVLVGGKWGELGIWDVDRYDKNAGAYCFNIHSKPVNCLTIQNSRPEHVFTTSYDGSIRRTDLISGMLEEVYSIEIAYNKYISWHAHQDENCLLVGNSEGYAVHVDLRKKGSKAERFAAHRRSVKVVAVHPTRSNYFATASADATVRLWDTRNFKKMAPISEVTTGRAVSCVEFSPVTGSSLVTTSQDDYLRIVSCDLTSLNTTKKIRHCNQTGRWLTTFKARFVPQREDLIFIGSLMNPRRVEVYDTKGNNVHNFMGEGLNSVNSSTAMHPTRPIFAGSNSSGKAFVFKAEV